MNSSGSALETADYDALLEESIMEGMTCSNEDMVPLNKTNPEVQDESDTASSDSSLTPRKPSQSRSRAKKARKAAHQNQKSNPSLRPAKDILSRLRHDPALMESDFIVGYHDRHAAVMEMDVSAWKGGGDVTDEDWIPQHRIMYFRKKGDEEGRRIWDRAARLDRLFGSGVIPDDHLTNDVEIGYENQDTSAAPTETAFINQDLGGEGDFARTSEVDTAYEVANSPSMNDDKT